jgi:Spy/CpxP family protein refolding chaperone
VRPALRSILVTIAVAFVAGLGGVGLGKLVFERASPRADIHDVLHRELDLNADQEERIAALERDFATRRHALELEMRAANVDLATAIREEDGYGPRVTAAVERFHDAMGELQTETIAHVFAMREVLTPEQKARFDDTVVSALVAEPQ